MDVINRVLSSLTVLSRVNSMLSKKSNIIRVCAALMISSIYLGWFKNQDYLGEKFSNESAFQKIHLVHKPFFENLIRDTKPFVSVESYSIPYTLMDWFNVLTLGYFAMFLQNYFTTSFSFPFLLSFVPFEYFFIYDFISTGKHFGLNGIFQNLFYYLLWIFIMYRIFRDCKHGLSDINEGYQGGPFSSIQDYWTILKGAFVAFDRSWNLGLYHYITTRSPFNPAGMSSNGMPNIDPSVFMNSFMGGGNNNPFMNMTAANSHAGARNRLNLQDLAEMMRNGNSNYYSEDGDESDGPQFSDVSVE